MTEIDEIIPLIEYDIEEGNHISWYHAKILLEHINSLITTIESQQNQLNEAVEKYEDMEGLLSQVQERNEALDEDNYMLIKKRNEVRNEVESQQEKIEIIKTAKERLLRYTRECRKERDKWQTRAIQAEQQVSQQLAEIESQKEEIERLGKLLQQSKCYLRSIDNLIDFSEEIPNGESMGSFEDASAINAVFKKAHSFLSQEGDK